MCVVCCIFVRASSLLTDYESDEVSVFDYLFRRFDRITSVTDVRTDRQTDSTMVTVLGNNMIHSCMN